MQLPKNYDKLTHKERKAVCAEYVRLQKGKCWYCKLPLDEEPVKDRPIKLWLFPEGFLDAPIHLQHDHSTGLTEGAVHGRCNAILWQYHGR